MFRKLSLLRQGFGGQALIAVFGVLFFMSGAGAQKQCPAGETFNATCGLCLASGASCPSPSPVILAPSAPQEINTVNPLIHIDQAGAGSLIRLTKGDDQKEKFVINNSGQAIFGDLSATPTGINVGSGQNLLYGLLDSGAQGNALMLQKINSDFPFNPDELFVLNKDGHAAFGGYSPDSSLAVTAPSLFSDKVRLGIGSVAVPVSFSNQSGTATITVPLSESTTKVAALGNAAFFDNPSAYGPAALLGYDGTVTATAPIFNGSSSASVYGGVIGMVKGSPPVGSYAAGVVGFDPFQKSLAGLFIGNVSVTGSKLNINNVQYSWPSATGGDGQVLTTASDGTLSWESPVVGGLPAGSSNAVQFNSSGVFGADASFVWDDVGNRLGIGIATPAEKLHVQGNLRVSGDTILGSASTKYTWPAIAGSQGKVLTWNGTSPTSGVQLAWTDASGGDNLGNHTLTGNLFVGSNTLDQGAGDGIQFQSGNGIRIGRQDSTGANFPITVKGQVDIRTASGTNAIKVYNQTAGEDNRFIVGADGRVGIKTSPATGYDLDVNGTARVIGDIYGDVLRDKSNPIYFVDPAASVWSVNIRGGIIAGPAKTIVDSDGDVYLDKVEESVFDANGVQGGLIFTTLSSNACSAVCSNHNLQCSYAANVESGGTLNLLTSCGDTTNTFKMCVCD